MDKAAFTNPTPNLDKAREEELTTSELQAAMRELRALGGDVGPLYAELSTDTYRDCVVRYGSRRHSADTIEDALLLWRDEIELEQARDEDPGTALAVKHGCICAAGIHPNDPQEITPKRDCPLHGEA